MQGAKEDTAKKTSVRKKAAEVKEFDDNGIVFFPEKLARLNAILDKAILLPHGNDKNHIQKKVSGKATKSIKGKSKQ